MFVKGLKAFETAVAHSGYSANETADGLKLVKVTDCPYAVFAKGEFVFYATLDEAVSNLAEESKVYILNYIPLYEGGVQTMSYDAGSATVNGDVTLLTLIRATDGTHSSFYVGGEEIYNNGASIAVPADMDRIAKLNGKIRVTGNNVLGIGDVSVF